ncbi:Methionine gamma-lyase [Striga hermonthica]|uniref:Methionine gamma-lyase n=1 Tax=Striga hermonthica TaxID=68872 RepID=A0A9N7N1J0_STRHE|nr:Methionine gamma-lyase [Striga hermonthica]
MRAQPLQQVPGPAAALADARHELGEHGGVNMSIEASVTFTVMDPDDLRRINSGELGPEQGHYIYSRQSNPTVHALGRLMVALEGIEAAYCTASGMSAISSVLLQLCSAGDHVVASRTLYGGTHALLGEFLPRACGLQVSCVDVRDHEMVRREMVAGRTKVLYFEAMSNPALTVANVPELCRIAHDKGVAVVVDNTFAPMVISVGRLGADVVVHSISKLISGGADILAATYPLNAALIAALGSIFNPTAENVFSHQLNPFNSGRWFRLQFNGSARPVLSTSPLLILTVDFDHDPTTRIFTRKTRPRFFGEDMTLPSSSSTSGPLFTLSTPSSELARRRWLAIPADVMTAADDCDLGDCCQRLPWWSAEA